jgi:uncharacterized membrane protein YiaA
MDPVRRGQQENKQGYYRSCLNKGLFGPLGKQRNIRENTNGNKEKPFCPFAAALVQLQLRCTA